MFTAIAQYGTELPRWHVIAQDFHDLLLVMCDVPHLTETPKGSPQQRLKKNISQDGYRQSGRWQVWSKSRIYPASPRSTCLQFPAAAGAHFSIIFTEAQPFSTSLIPELGASPSFPPRWTEDLAFLACPVALDKGERQSLAHSATVAKFDAIFHLWGGMGLAPTVQEMGILVPLTSHKGRSSNIQVAQQETPILPASHTLKRLCP